jgi:hypothetical protein
VNAGKKTIEWLYRDQLSVEAAWSVRHASGFTWWPHRHAQHIEVVRELADPGGDVGYLLRIRTEFAKNPKLETAGPLLDLVFEVPTMAGLVFDPMTKTMFLSSAVCVHAGNWQWMARLLSCVAMLQAAEAHALADKVALGMGGASAASGHPTSGVRAAPDAIAASFPRIVHQYGQQPSMWSEAEFAAALRNPMQQPPTVLANGGGAGVTIEFPFGDFTSLCQINGDQAHPRVGNGLFFLQSFPVDHLGLSESAMRDFVLKCNAEELWANPRGYGFGSYCYRDGCLRFNAFLPNLLHSPGLLPNLYFQAAARAAHMERFLLPASESEDAATGQPARPKSAMARMLDFFMRR